MTIESVETIVGLGSAILGIFVFFILQGKIIRDGEEKKIDLFNLTLNTANNFLADSVNWSDLRSSLRASATSNFDFTITSTHSFYKPTSSGSGRRNEFVWSDGFGLPRLVNLQMNARMRIAPPPPEKDESEAVPDTTALADSLESFNIGEDPITAGLRDFKLPWDLTANFTYNINKNNINNILFACSQNMNDLFFIRIDQIDIAPFISGCPNFFLSAC